MILTSENILLFGSILLFLSIIASKTSRFGIPTLVLFLGIGMLAGTDGIGNIYFDNPQIAQFVGVIALNLILFSGGLDTRWEVVKPVLWRGISLSTIGVFFTAVSLGVFVYFLLNFSWTEALLLGAIVSSTDAAAVFTILRSNSIGLKDHLRPTLELESGSNDPMAYFLTVSLTTLVTQPEISILSLVPMFFMQMIIGGAMGYLMGRLMIRIINKINLGFEGLYLVLVAALLFFTFSFTDFIGGNGFLAVYISAVVLGNSSFIHKRSLIKFYDGMAWLMQIIMFLTLGLLVFPTHVIPVIGIGLLISLFLIFVARPLGVFFSLIFFKMHNRNRLFISWVGLRGAVPIVFATYPLIAGVEKASMIFNIVFFIAVLSVTLQGTTLSLMARWLGLSIPEPEKTHPLDIELSEDVKSELVEIKLSPNSIWADKTLIDLKFPETALIVLIKRQDQYVTPRGSTTLEGGDLLLVMADNKETLGEIRQKLEA